MTPASPLRSTEEIRASSSRHATAAGRGLLMTVGQIVARLPRSALTTCRLINGSRTRSRV